VREIPGERRNRKAQNVEELGSFFVRDCSHREIQHDLPSVPFGLGSALRAVWEVPNELCVCQKMLHVAVAEERSERAALR